MPDPRTVFMAEMCDGEKAVLAELAMSQVVKIPLDEYQPGHPHYERLVFQMELHQRFQFPSSMETNV